jgi:hypothetical protein
MLRLACSYTRVAARSRAIAKNAGGGAARIAALDREVRAAHRYTLCRLPLVDRVFADHSGAGRRSRADLVNVETYFAAFASSVTHKYAGLIQLAPTRAVMTSTAVGKLFRITSASCLTVASRG